MKRTGKRLTALVGLLVGGLFLTACAQTQYVETAHTGSGTGAGDPAQASSDDLLPLIARHVDYGSSRELYRTAPRCIMVMPLTTASEGASTVSASGQGLSASDRWRMSDAVARAVGRHLSDKVDRVVSAEHVRSAARWLAVTDDDEKRLGRHFRCEAAMRIKSQGLETLYALVFTNARLDLGLLLVDIRTETPLWWGRHAANRHGGGPPTGLLSLPFDALEAGNLANDPELLPSMADDAARRVLASLPDLKGPLQVLPPDIPRDRIAEKDESEPPAPENAAIQQPADAELTGRALFERARAGWAPVNQAPVSAAEPSAAKPPEYR